MHSLEIWMKGILAAAIAGAANGVITGFAAVGIDPAHFNLQAGIDSTLAISGVSAMMSAIIDVAAYLKQSPLPPQEMPPGPERDWLPETPGPGARERRDEPERRRD